MSSEKAREALRRVRRKRRAFIDSLKDKPCADCGIRFHPFVMDLDHRDPAQKRLHVSAMYAGGFSLEAIQEEADKCDVVCANCHRMRTFLRREKTRLPVPEPDKPAPKDRTHCPQGHPYDETNTRIRTKANGYRGRECIECIRKADRVRGQAARTRARQLREARIKHGFPASPARSTPHKYEAFKKG